MTDTAETAQSPAKPMSALGAFLRLAGGFLIAVFAAGVASGVVMTAREHGEFGLGAAIGVALAAALLVGGIWLMLSVRRRFSMPRSPRVRRSRIALYVALGVSMVVGAATGIAGHMSNDLHGEPMDVFGSLLSSAPIGTAFALAALAGWIAAIAVSVYWHLTLDEIERAEYEFGATLALYAYVSIAPAWWIAWRGGMLPEPSGVAIFLIVCTVWCIGWGWRRYR